MKKAFNSFLIFIGFWLSPLSPWNDLFTNIPLAYIFAWPFSLINESLFLPMAILGYWISNILWFLLMHYGYVQIKEKNYNFKDNWKTYLLATTAYTILIGLLIYFEVLPAPQEIMGLFN